MKRIQIAIVLVLATTLLTLLFHSWTDDRATSKEENVTLTVVAATQMNVLYVGVENSIMVASSGINSSELEIAVDNGTVTGENGEFILIPEKAGLATVAVKYRGNEIEKTMFRVKSGMTVIPVLLYDSLKYQAAGAIYRSQMLAAIGIDVVAEDSDFDVRFEILQFTLSCSGKESTSMNSTFNEQQRLIIRESKLDDEIVIDNIEIKLTDGSTRNLPRMTFKISG